MYIPQIQPVPRDDNLLIHAAAAIADKRQENQLKQLATQAIGGDQNALAQLYATDPRTGAGISDYITQNKQQAQQVILGGAATLLHANPEERPALYQQALPLLKKYMPDAPDQYPGDQALTGFVAQIAAQGGEHGAFATTLLQGSGLIPPKPTDAYSNYQTLSALKTPEEQQRFMNVLHSGGEQGPKVVGLGGKLISPSGQVLADNPLAKALGPNESLVSIGPDGQAVIKATTGPGGQQKPYGATDYPAGGAPVYGPNGQPLVQPGPTTNSTPSAPATPAQQQQSLQAIESAKKAGEGKGELLAKQPIAAAALREALAGADRLKATADQLYKHPGLKGITGLQGLAPNWPGSDAANAQTILNNLVSQAEISVISSLKTASQTGATGFGQLSEQEGKILQNFISSLDLSSHPSEDLFKDNVKKISDYVDGFKQRLSAAYDQTYGAQPVPASAAGIAPAHTIPTGGRKPLSAFAR